MAEMEGQVDTYRAEGKEEAAARLEDQLTLIHTKFQVVSGKFELFQRPSDFDGRLGRVTRQLVDLQANIYLTDIISHETETIEVRAWVIMSCFINFIIPSFVSYPGPAASHSLHVQCTRQHQARCRGHNQDGKKAGAEKRSVRSGQHHF